MLILISLVLALALAWFGAGVLKKHAGWFYLGAIALSAATAGCALGGVELPGWLRASLWPLLSNGALATALFMVVMFMAVLPNGSAAMKRLMPIRAELSILASLLIFGHNLTYGGTYFRRLFLQPGDMPAWQLLAAVCSLVMLVILIPLFLTSFRAVRKKMKGKTWKRLQRAAYAFYGLTYVHVMLLNTGLYQGGNRACLWNLLIYTAIYATYAALRLGKALAKRRPHAAKVTRPLCAAAGVLVCALCLIPWQGNGGEAALAQEPVAYADGSYIGTGKGYNGDITVRVKVKEGAIIGVTVVQTADDNPYWSNALALIDSVLAQQSAQVDGISGATYSSKGLKEAIAQALEGAVGE